MDILSYDDLKYSGGSRGGARVTRPPPPPPPLNFETKLRPQGQKKYFCRPPLTPPPPPLSQGLDPAQALNYTSSTMLSYGTVVQGGLN